MKKTYYSLHKEVMCASARKWREENREKFNEYHREYYKAHRSTHKAYCDDWRMRNRDKHNAYARASYRRKIAKRNGWKI